MKHYPNPASYVDYGSAFHFNRSAFLRLNRDIQAGKIDVLIMRDISRIGRDISQVQKWLAGICKGGAKLIVTDCLIKKNLHRIFIRRQRESIG